MDLTIGNPKISVSAKTIVNRFGVCAFEPEVIDEDGRVGPRFQYLVGEFEWRNLSIQTQVSLILEFVASLQADGLGSLQEIPF